MSLKLYELRVLKERSLSPFVWRTRMALAHKGLTPEIVPIGYGEKRRIAFSGQDRVPVLCDGDRTVADSWAIAGYLEDAYPDRPSLLGGELGRAGALFFNRWADTAFNGALVLLVVGDTFDHVPEADKPYFRENREQRFGVSMEALRQDPEGKVGRVREVLAPVRQVLQRQPFLAGERPAYLDYILFGSFQWARTISRYRLLAADDPVYAWRRRMLGLFDGLAAAAPGYGVDGEEQLAA